MPATPFERHRAEAAGAGRLTAPTHVARREDPACGDRLTLELRVEGGRIADLAWQASACAGTLAAAGALYGLARGRPARAGAVSREELDAVLGGLAPARRHALRLVVATLEDALAAPPATPPGSSGS
ncbi:MAG: iron-sulfur cluster assembly scaffold protein [Planctomycetota bacterium]